MKASSLLKNLEKRGVEKIIGVPDSTLKQFCDGLQTYQGKLEHFCTVNEGAAVGVAIGSYLGSGKPACVYMQNSGIGNAVNPIASLANKDVYGVPILFLVGWRGEPGVHDEPQHVFQGKITCELFEVMQIPYTVIDSATTDEEMDRILDQAWQTFGENKQYAIIVKKGSFEKEADFKWENGNTLVREQVLGTVLKTLPGDAVIVSTTGKSSRELYEQSDLLFGNHEKIFMTVGGMGHASMIAFGVAKARPDKKVVCIDGDGAALMHMGSMAFLAENAPENFYHIVINNQAHESVGAMPTDCQDISFAKVAETLGYRLAKRMTTMEEVEQIGTLIDQNPGPILMEIPVNLEVRADLGRPKETAAENKFSFMANLS